MKKFLQISLLPISLLAIMPAYAATSIDLMHQPASALSPFLSGQPQMQVMETSRTLDSHQILHVRIQQLYSGYQVFGADAVVHVPQADKLLSLANIASEKSDSYMNGTLYANIAADLANTSKVVFDSAQANKALERGIENYQRKLGGKPGLSQQKSELLVYVDNSNIAHWAYKVSFVAAPIKKGAMVAKPVYIMDAVSFHVYAEWNDIKTADGGGYGGNVKMGKLVYDGLNKSKHYAKLVVTRDAKTKICKLENADVNVKSEKTNAIITYKCSSTNSSHNNVYWDGALGAVNGGQSPGNDALFGGQVIKRLYQDWYGIPVLKNSDGSPMMLNMVVNSDMDNAYWDGYQMVFGDGIDMFYPLTSLGVAAHEVSHGFTEQHSNLNYSGQSGGMNESFSDMAAQAAEVYAYGVGRNSWQIGPEIFKAPDEALRYMDKPSKDCGGGTPGNWCSIDDASQYTNGIDVHYSSGVYNRFFYLLGTSKDWSVRQAFDVMVDANSNYWTSTTNFKTGACGVLQAAKDSKYDLTAVKKAFDTVKVDYSDCVVKG